MKNAFVFVLLAATSQANAWEKLIECNDGELVIDQGYDVNMRRPNHQLVLRGKPLETFLKQRAIDPTTVNNKAEFVIPLSKYDSSLVGVMPYFAPYGEPHTYRHFWVTRSGNNVAIRATIGNRLQGENEISNWQFANCR